MAISDQSIYNTYIARSLTKNDVRNFTVGTMPEEVSREVEEMVAQSIADNSGRIPKDLYGKVADKIRQYVPGMERNALASVLKANGIFGLTGADASVKSVGTGLEKQRNLSGLFKITRSNQVRVSAMYSQKGVFLRFSLSV